MAQWIVFLRGINVGGNSSMPMAQLRTALIEEGFEGVRTYIQSGNVLLTSAERNAIQLQQHIGEVIQRHFGFRPQIMAMTTEQLEAVARANPFPTAEPEPKSLHVYFLAEPATAANLSALDTLKSENESYALTERALYLHAPDGIGRSKLAERIERHVGVAATARNWRTVQTMLDMAQTKQGVG